MQKTQTQVYWLLRTNDLSLNPICTGGGIGVARIFDWGGPNHKSPAMTSSEIFKRGSFYGAKIS